MGIINHPYPLLDNDTGNFSNFSFDAELVECKIEDGLYKFHVKAETDEPSIEKLVTDGDAAFVLQVDCKPFLRKLFKAENKGWEIIVELDYREIPSDFSFELTPLVITEKALSYLNPNCDSPMNAYSFELTKNQVLASHEALTVSFERSYKLIESGPIIKIIKMPDGKKPSCGTMDINLGDDSNIIVHLAEDVYTKFREINSCDPNLLNAVLSMPVLQYTLSEVSNKEELWDRHWAKLLDEEFGIFDISAEQEEILKKCDEILEKPIVSYFDHFTNNYINN
jgi:hypothetical protein